METELSLRPMQRRDWTTDPIILCLLARHGAAPQNPSTQRRLHREVVLIVRQAFFHCDSQRSQCISKSPVCIVFSRHQGSLRSVDSRFFSQKLMIHFYQAKTNLLAHLHFIWKSKLNLVPIASIFVSVQPVRCSRIRGLSFLLMVSYSAV